MNERLPSADESERAVLSMLLSHGEAILAQTELRPDAFLDPRIREIWAAAESVFRRGGHVEPSAVADELQSRGRLDAIGGYSGLSELADRYPAADNVAHYAAQIRRAHSKRRLAIALHDLRTRALNPDEEPVDVLSLAQRLLAEAVEERGDRTKSLYAAARDLVDAKQAEINAIRSGAPWPRLKTGWPEVDDVLGGIPDCLVTVLGAGTSHGKSAAARGLAQNWAEADVPTHVFPLEDDTETNAERALADWGDVHLQKFSTKPEELSNLEWGRIAGALERLRAADKILVDDTTPRSIEQIAMRVRKHKPRHGTRVVIVDYLQKLRDPRIKPGPGWQKHNVDVALDGASRLAREERVAVVLCSQLSREAAREGRAPELHDLRESGEIEQQARCVLAIYRPEKDARKAEERAALAGESARIWAKPMTPLIGVRISWLTMARNSLLARSADSAASLASRRASSARPSCSSTGRRRRSARRACSPRWRPWAEEDSDGDVLRRGHAEAEGQ